MNRAEGRPLRLAFELAARGFEVVPLGHAKGPKIPTWKDWQNRGVSTPLDVMAQWPGAEFWPGVLTGKKAIVIDVDVKDGRDGLAQLARLESEIGKLPETYTVRTGSGGLHLYFEPPAGEHYGNAPLRDTEGNVIKSIDVRGYGGQVVAPGAIIDGLAYTVARDVPMAPLPPALAARLRIAPKRTADGTDKAEAPGARALAEDWLKTRAPKPEAGSRDNTGFQIAAKLYNFGCGRDTIRELVADWYVANPAGDDDIGDDDFERWANSAFRSAQDAHGRDNPMGMLPPVPDIDTSYIRAADVAAHAVARKAVSGFAARPYSATEATDAAIPPRPWLVDKLILREAVTVLAAPGSTGKSLWALQLAFALALGNPVAPKLLGREVAEPAQTLVINNEDPDDELDRRMAAVSQFFQLDRGAAAGRVHLYSGVKSKLKVALKSREFGAVEGPQLAALREYIKANGIGCVVFDPLVSLHDMNESDNSEMQRVMEVLTSLASELAIAVVIVTHTPKPPLASSESYAGTINAIRGATAIKDAARIAVTLFNMTEKDGEIFGVPANIRHRYVRMDDAKLNHGLATPDAQWFVKRSVRIGNGEELGVLEPIALKKDEALAARKVELSAALFPSVGVEGLALADAVAIARQTHGHISSEAKALSAVAELFQSGEVQHDGRRLRLLRNGKTGGRIVPIL